MSTKPKPRTRHGQRADGQTTMSLSISKEIKSALQELADKDGRSVSNYLSRMLENLLFKK